jgi:PPOX class probable F420-dependent enzyme
MADDLSEKAVELLTNEVSIGHLGTSHDDRPHVAPVWYAVHDGDVEIVTTGQKLANIRRNPRVALSVQNDVDGEARWGVTLRGTATVVEDETEGEAIFRRINERYGADEDAWDENTPVRIDVGSSNAWTYD